MDTTLGPGGNGASAVLSLRGPQWRRFAPPSVVRAYRTSDAAGWNQWVAHLRQRRRPKRLHKLLRAKNPPLLWGLDALDPNRTPHFSDLHASRALVARLFHLSEANRTPDKHLAAESQAWLNDTFARPADLPLAIESLAWSAALPTLASHLAADTWWELLERLTHTARDAAALDLASDPLAQQQLAGELPLTLAYLFPELRGCAAAPGAIRQTLSQGVVELLNGEGLPRASDLSQTRGLLACWTRCAAIAQALGEACFEPPAREQLPGLLTAALRLTRSDGTPTLAPAGTPWSNEFLAVAQRHFADKTATALARRLNLVPSSPPRRKPAPLPKSSYHCGWSRVALLRPRWSSGGRRLTVAYGDDVRIELESAQRLLFSGEWTCSLTIDGQPAQPAGPWEEICWLKRKRDLYVELERDLIGGRKIQRHVLLADRDGFVLLADAVLGEEPARLDYAATVPLPSSMFFQPAHETREGWLYPASVAGGQSGGESIRRRDAKAACLPLALPEWRVDPRGGTLAPTAGGTDSPRGLQLRQSAHGACLFAPLFIDVRRRRLTRELTWRQLTVAEDRRNLPPDRAVGYRVQIGRRQWLVYRSLAPAGNRTLLGKNLITQFYVGRFFTDGRTKTIVEIE